MLLKKFTEFKIENISEIKGGFRYVTTSQSSFEKKRNSLQSKGESMCISHTGNHYCIEW